MIAGASWAFWVGFHAVVAALVAFDGWIANRSGGHERPCKRPWWIPVAVVIVVAAAFAAWLDLAHGRQWALEFAAGYGVELSLSIDNLFVFLVLFQGFEIGPERQHRALTWGVGGAIALRALFVWAGVVLLRRFEWVSWLLGLFLLYTALRLARSRSAHGVIPAWIRRLQPARGSLLPVILAVEFTDLLFATDSIPAVLSITRNPLLAYTSNVAAVLCLRSLYFGLARALDRLRFLNYGLAVLLAFVGVKMLLSAWIEVPVTLSLAIIGGILAACAAAGALPMNKQRGP